MSTHLDILAGVTNHMAGETVLFVSSDSEVIGTVRRAVAPLGHRLLLAASLEEASRRISAHNVDLVLVQTDSPESNVRARLAKGMQFRRAPAVIALAKEGRIEDAVRAVRAGADDYVLANPSRSGHLRACIRRALNADACGNNGNGNGSSGRRPFESLITVDYRVEAACQIAAVASESTAPLLLQGESGTGKSLLAGLVHQHSPRRLGPFVEVNCGALNESLLESELFGHARGAFTSAYRDRPGRFERANGGSLFLDEIGCASLRLQARLLRFVESGAFERVGEVRTLHSDVRIIAATKESLSDAVYSGTFREDLYHRLNSLKITMPPLRERVEDIPVLMRHFLRTYVAKHRRPGTRISIEAVDRLVHYHWPGNVRELGNVIEHAVIMAQNGSILPTHLPAHLREPQEADGPREALSVASLKESLREPERNCIYRALRAAGWNKQSAARKLRISRSTLYKKMKEYGLDREASKGRHGAPELSSATEMA